jgi:hypothetical protein
LVRLGYLRLSLDRLPYVNVRYSANTAWTNPDFDPELPAVYDARVLEIPTPRWTAYEAVPFGIHMPSPDVPMTTQQRAYTSPIWYTPTN